MDIHEKLCTIIDERKILKEKSLNNQALVQNFNNFEHADSINVGLAIQNSKFKMLWEQNSRSIDVQSLEEDLRNLLVELKHIGQNNNCIEDIVKIAKACELAKHNNGAGVLERLSGVNEWVLDFAKNIGSNVAATAISKSLGIV